MSLYSINVNLPGAKSIFTSEAVTVAGSSTIIPMFVVAVNPSKMQQTIDGYLSCGANTDPSSIIVTHTVALAANELVGNFAYVMFPTPSIRQIASNTAAAANAPSTITVDRPFTTAPTSGEVVNIRRWEDFAIPRLFSSVQSFAETYIDKDASGNYDWDTSDNAYYTLSEFKAKGGSLFYVLPVISSSVAGNMVEHLAPTSNATFLSRMLQLSPQPILICCPKQHSLEATLSAANWASVDNAWLTYIESRGSDDLADDKLRQLVYIADAGSTVARASAVTYRTSDLNSTSAQCELVYGSYMTDSLTRGQRQPVAGSPARCGVINSVSTKAPESFGHAFCGANYTTISTFGLVDRDLSPEDRITLIGNGINPLISAPGKGFWFESQLTQKKSSATAGEDPLEHLHVTIGRAQIWNGVQPILASVIAEPNTSTVRAGLKARVSSFLDQFVQQGIIQGYVLDDVTTGADATSGTARLELKVVFAREIDFIELKLVAQLGG